MGPRHLPAVVAAIGLTASGAGGAAGLTIGTAANPFANTCDGKAIGFFTEKGERPQMRLSGAPTGALLECRTGRIAEVASLPFRPCDGDKGSQPLHVPTFGAEGTYRTEVRSVVGKVAGPPQSVTYYVHHSLDRVACCAAGRPDRDWFAAARKVLAPGAAFGSEAKLDNPFIKIVAGDRDRELLSLRRSFRLDEDRKLLLIRRTMTSRTFGASPSKSCVGLTIGVPDYGVRAGDGEVCPPRRESAFHGGLVDPDCPKVYCTVSTCAPTKKGCIQVTHTFNRGPGQQPWIVRQPEVCPDERVVGFRQYDCDAYVLDRTGAAACLVDGGAGGVRVLKTIAATERPLGLVVLGEQSGSGDVPDRYVFSAKSRHPTGTAKVLHLPP